MGVRRCAIAHSNRHDLRCTTGYIWNACGKHRSALIMFFLHYDDYCYERLDAFCPVYFQTLQQFTRLLWVCFEEYRRASKRASTRQGALTCRNELMIQTKSYRHTNTLLNRRDQWRTIGYISNALNTCFCITVQMSWIAGCILCGNTGGSGSHTRYCMPRCALCGSRTD